MDVIKQRCVIEYDLRELDIIQKESYILSTEIEVNSLKGINVIHDNQWECGKAVRNIFNNRSIINCLVYGKTQSGKTGCMTSMIKYYIASNNIPIENIYIITGLNDIEWKKDTKNRMPRSLESRVFHRSNLIKTFANDIKEKKNCLIIMDEIQIACEDYQTINKTFIGCGFYDLDFLLNNDIKLIQFSATPDGHINDIANWKNYSAKLKLSPGPSHYGPEKAIEQDRVKQFKDLTIIENVKELKNDIEGKFVDERYYLIRVPNKRENKTGSNNQLTVIDNFKKVFGESYEYNKRFLEVKKGDINDILEIKPKKHTFIFCCEILRCAKTQFKKYIGLSYERYCKDKDINDSTMVQGSFGRMNGYDDNGDSICYTNVDSVLNYIKLWDNNMIFKEGIIWNTKTTQYNSREKITSCTTNTFNNPNKIEQLKEYSSSDEEKEFRCEPIIKKFYGDEALNDVISWFKNNLKDKMPKGTQGPRIKTKNEEGFYEGAIRNGKQVLSTAEVNKEYRWGFKEGSSGVQRNYPCYSDTKDPKTLEWWLIYYEK
jgi:hypothetical protein